MVEIKFIKAYNNAISIKSGLPVMNPNKAINSTVAVPNVLIAKIRSKTVGPKAARSKIINITTRIAIVAVMNIYLIY